MSDGRIQSTYDWAETPPSTAVIDAIDSLEGTNATELDVVLAKHVHTDALDDLFSYASDSKIQLTIGVGTYRVTLEDSGRVTVTRTD
ncbi:MAG: HalOD1 output domain-containing protein [Halobacteriota archaeon]